MVKSIGAALRRSALAAMVGLAGVTATADAAVFVAKWDPLFNSNFDADFAWRGSGTASIGATCLAPANWGSTVVVGTVACPLGDANLTVASVGFYDNDLGVGAPSVGGLGWAGSFPLSKVAISPTGAVAGVEIVGALSTFFPFSNANLTTALIDMGGSWFADLNFFLDGPQLVLTEDLGPSLLSILETECVDDCYCYDDCDVPRTFFSDAQDGGTPRPQLTWTQVPEPASLALIGAALAGFGLSRRQKVSPIRSQHHG